MDSLSKVFGLIALAFSLVFSRGVAASYIWDLFIPRFFGLPELPVLIAIALSALLQTLSPNTPLRKCRESSVEEVYGMMLSNIVAPWIGYLVVLLATNLYF